MAASRSIQVRSLIKSIRAHFAQQPCSDATIARELAHVLTLLNRLPASGGDFAQSGHAVTRHVEAALNGGSETTAALLEKVRPVIEFLPWHYGYAPRNDAPDLGQRIAFAELIGPLAPYRSDSVCLGLTIIGPETLYPCHRHPAVELYYVAAGVATWTLDGVERDHPPGSFILHPSQAVHAMQTRAQPLLAIYTWSGTDVRTTSAYTPPARSAPAEPSH